MSAIKLARVCLMAKIVWQPDAATRELREVFFAHRAAVKDCTRLRNVRTFLNEHCVRLPKGTALTQQSGLRKALSMHPWSNLQQGLITDSFAQLWQTEARRKQLEQLMVEQLLEQPEWAQLWRLMGVRHIVAFALMAMIGDIHRFPTAKKLVGYFGLSPRKVQSGNNAKGREKGMGNTGVVMCGAHPGRPKCHDAEKLSPASMGLEAHPQKGLQEYRRCRSGPKTDRRDLAPAARGHFTPLLEMSQPLKTKLLKIATLLGKAALRAGLHK